MKSLAVTVTVIAFIAHSGLGQGNQFRPLFKDQERFSPKDADVGEPLYLTPYIKSGDIATAKSLAEVTEPLDGIPASDQPTSYSGLITVNNATNSNIFFWFFPATDVDPAEAPVVIWLQGGPGSSSMFGLFEINGPFSAVYTEDGSSTTAKLNPHSWTTVANVMYVDNPVGTGFSHTTDDFAVNQDDVGTDLYEFLTQWFTLFEEFKDNEFFAFGESYAGKYVPTISKKIHDENQSADFKINFKGLGIGNGAIDPTNAWVYGQYLYQNGLVDGRRRDVMLQMEDQLKQEIEQELWVEAWTTWSLELNYYLGNMGCSNHLDVRNCHNPAEENNYADYVNLETTRKAIHVGDIPFGDQSGEVYDNLLADMPKSTRPVVEFLLEYYPVMIYDGAMDIVCHPVGNFNMLDAMETWSGIEEYQNAPRELYLDASGGDLAYIVRAANLRLVTVRNANHMVPRDQPEGALKLFTDFVRGQL